MNCSRCGAYYGSTQRYCTGCGLDILAAQEQQPTAAYAPPAAYQEEEMRGQGYHAPGGYGSGMTSGAATYAPPSGSSPRRRSGAGPIGAGAVGLIALLSKLKGLLVLLKFGKFSGTLITMLISVGAYAAFFGLPFALGFVILLLIHEMGHWIVLRAKGVPSGAPVFIPFLGAVIAMRGRPRNVKDEAEIGIGGPIAGTAASLLTGIAAAVMPPGHTQNLLYALGYTGLLLNLFNLIPVSPLDGGRVVAAISRWAWPVGLALLAALLFTHPSGILLLILILGGFETFNRFMRNDRYVGIPGYYTVAAHERLALALVFFGLLGVAFGGLELFHNQLLAIQSGTV